MDNNNSMINRIMLLHELKIKYLNFDAIFSDETPMFRTPAEPEKNSRVAIRLRVARDNVDKCSIQLEESFIVMEKVRSTTRFDFYEGSFITGSKPVNYYFLIEKDGRKYCYNKQGVLPQADPAYNFCIMPGFHTPDWAKGAVMYQIYVDRFFDGDKNNDVLDDEYVYLGARAKMVKDWYAPLENFDVCNFYGGDLQGVMAKMHYLKSLGIDAIYFNPVFVSPSNHKYDIQDYDYIDPHYGVIVNDGTTLVPEGDTDNSRADMYMVRTTDKENLEESNKLMIRLIEMAHSMGIRIILDGVFNHCGAFNKWLDREGFYERNGYEPGAFKNENSRYRDYFKWNEDGFYDGWWGHDNHPKLNFEGSKELYDYIIGIGKKWVSPPFNADGWRLDVAADLGCSKEFNMQFWRDFRKAVKEANPDAIILAEHYGDPKDWLMGDQWDTVMNYDAFMEPVSFFLTGMEKHSDHYDSVLYANGREFFYMLREKMSRLPGQSLLSAMNELSNHDHSRFLTRTNHRVGRLQSVGALAASEGISYAAFREGIVMQFTLPGAPTIYYGDETGVCGWTDPDCRRTYPWGEEKWDLITFHRDMIRMHKNLSFLRTGSFRELMDDYGLVVYGRFDENGSAAVVINHSDRPRKLRIPVRTIEMPENGRVYRILETTDVGYNIGVLKKNIRDGILYAELEGWSAAVYSTAVF